MSNAVIGYPNRGDEGTLSGGSWESDLPLANLQDGIIAKVARSADATKANTQWEDDLGQDRPIRLLGLHNHNLSLDALVRLRGKKAADTLVELDAVTNLAGEYGLQIYPESDYRVSAPSNVDLSGFTISAWVQPDFSSSESSRHEIVNLFNDVDNRALLYWDGGTWECRIVADGTTVIKSITPAPSFSAGDTIFVGLRFDGTNIELLADVDGDNTLESATDTNGGTISTGSPTVYVGQDSAGSGNRAFEGAINLLITDDGSSDDAIQDRFNGGNGQSLEDWLATVNDGGSGLPHSENLVLHVGGNSDGSSVQLDTFAGATQLLSDPEDGGYDFDGTDDKIDFGAFTETDGSATLTAWGEIEVDAATGHILGHWNNGTDGEKSWRIGVNGSGQIFFEIATDGAGASETYTHPTVLTGSRWKFMAFFNGGAGTNANKVQIAVAQYQSATRDYGSWDNDALGDASTPASLRTPTAVNLTAGVDAGDLNWYEGKIYDLRLTDLAVDSSTRLDQELDQVYHDDWKHWWPLEGDADDQIGSLNGTINGATSVTDGRSLSGRFERFTRQGRYNFDGSDDDVNFGAYTESDGQSELSIWGETEIDSLTGIVFGHWNNSSNGQKNWRVATTSGDALFFEIATDGSGSAETYQHSVAINSKRIRWFVRFKGDEASNADKVQIGVSVYDPATGIYGAWTTEQLGDASTPGSLRTPTAVDLTAASGASNGQFTEVKIDELRINAGTALSVATLEANTIYSRTDADWDHAWEFDGNANDAIGSLDGTVTGAQQVADGRQPVGWTKNPGGGNPRVDRATGINEADEGVYGTRVKSASSNHRIQQATLSKSDESWVVISGRGRSTGADLIGLLTSADFDGGNQLSDDFPNQASLADVGVAGRASDGTDFVLLVRTTTGGAEGYADDLRAYELATVSFSTSDVGFIYDTGWISPWPTVYESGSELWGEERTGSLSQEDLDALDQIDFIHAIPTTATYADSRGHITARYWSVEVDDTGNGDGYVEVGRFFCSPAYQPSLNFVGGAQLGYHDRSDSVETDGGAMIHNRRRAPRTFEATYERVPSNEALVQLLEIQRRVGTTRQLLFVYDPDDETHMHRRSFVATMQELSPLVIPYASWHDQAVSFIEEL